MQSWSVGALPLHREPLLPCVAILCVDLSKHDKFVQVKNKALCSIVVVVFVLVFGFCFGKKVQLVEAKLIYKIYKYVFLSLSVNV